MYPNSGKVPCSVGCKSDCLVNSAESSLRSIHSSAYVRTLSWTSDIIIILWLSTNRLNRDSLSYRVISLSSWQKFGVHLMNGGQLFQWEFASEGWCDRSDRFKKAEIDPFSVVASFFFFFVEFATSLWAVPLFQAITECIVIVRKSVLRLECHRKLAYVMNTLQKWRTLRATCFECWKLIIVCGISLKVGIGYQTRKIQGSFLPVVLNLHFSTETQQG